VFSKSSRRSATEDHGVSGGLRARVCASGHAYRPGRGVAFIDPLRLDDVTIPRLANRIRHALVCPRAGKSADLNQTAVSFLDNRDRSDPVSPDAKQGWPECRPRGVLVIDIERWGSKGRPWSSL